MANMGYCRFQNTVEDLRDCVNHLHDELSPDEERARQRLVELCRRIADQAPPPRETRTRSRRS